MYEVLKALKELPEETFFREIYLGDIDHELSSVICGNITFLSKQERQKLENFFRKYGGEGANSNQELAHTCRYVTRRLFRTPIERRSDAI